MRVASLRARRPPGAMAQEMFPWPNAMIDLPDDPSRAVEFIKSLLSESNFISETRTRNVTEMCRRHDWRYRIWDIYQQLRLAPPDNLKRELQALAALKLTERQFRWDPGATVTGIVATRGASPELTTMAAAPSRRLFMVLSPRSLSYARLALRSLYANCVEPFALTLITDGPDDVRELRGELDGLRQGSVQPSRAAAVYGEADLADLERDRFGKYPELQQFRHGHPCWRKITDPLLLSDDRDEMIVLDPDLYFPNRFRFEETPSERSLADVAASIVPITRRGCRGRHRCRNIASASHGHRSCAMARACRPGMAELAY